MKRYQIVLIFIALLFVIIGLNEKVKASSNNLGTTYYLKNSIAGGSADKVITYGRSTDEVLVGDWNGDGVDTLAVRRGNTYYFKNSIAGGSADKVIAYGKATDKVLVGDWNGDGVDTLAVRRGNTYYFKNSLAGGAADKVIAYGKSTDNVIIGDWDGNGTDTLAVRRGNTYYFKNSLAGGAADKVIAYGKSTDNVIIGDWDGNGTDTLGVRRPLVTYSGILNNIANSKTAMKTNQIIGVVAKKSYATVYLFEKKNGIWSTILSVNGRVGKNGIGKTAEGDGKTPRGSYALGFAFGTGANPGTKVAYRQITKNSYWISNTNDSQYNTWQERSSSSKTDEHLINYPVQYKYAMVIDYNTSNIKKGAGSAIFLHCNGTGYTAGCVSVPQSTMLTLLKTISNGAYIMIGNSASELQSY